MPSNGFSSLGRFVRNRRLELSLTQGELATRVGPTWNQGTVSRLERGQVDRPAPWGLRALAVALDLPPEHLWGLSGWARAGAIMIDAPVAPGAHWSVERRELMRIVADLSDENVQTLLRIAQLMAAEGYGIDSRQARKKLNSAR